MSHFSKSEKAKLHLNFPKNQDILSVTPKIQILMLGQAKIVVYMFVNISPKYACTALIMLKLVAIKKKKKKNNFQFYVIVA